MASTICLNMIVKDEAHVIRRCLDSVRPFIDSWVIVDTGSTDGTQDIIRNHLKDVPGELFERPWKNFGHNRTEALQLARDRGRYLFVMDADDELVLAPGFVRPDMTADAYYLPIKHGDTEHWRVNVVSSRLDWKYVGVLHEYLESRTPYSTAKLTNGVHILIHAEGARSKGLSDAEKYLRDARILEQGLVDEPGNARYVFYLAQSYRDAGQPKIALKTYQRRAAMGGWDEEVWYALFQVARLRERLELAPETITQRYLDAYQARPQRAEPLVELARMCREKKQFVLAHLFASKAKNTPRPEDILFLDTPAYTWRALDEFAVASYWTGDYRACASACQCLLDGNALPFEHLSRVTANLNFALEKLGKG
jgi:glycosyltransferase involved in cell wall biosynthesis